MENLKNLLFIDIETACDKKGFEDLSEGMKAEWRHKAAHKWREEAGEDPESLYFRKAGMLAEFGRIVCISIGCLYDEAEPLRLVLKSFYDADEKALLTSFCQSLGTFVQKRGEPVLIGHNSREFDLPFISRRMVIHGMSLPGCLKLLDKKPWEIPHQDTLQMWRFGDPKASVKLSLLCELLGVPSPKDEISGEDITRVFWEEQNLPRIARYCEKDVLATARVYFHLQGMHRQARSLREKEPLLV